MEFELFKSMLLAIEQLENIIRDMNKLLGVEICGGSFVEAQSNLLTTLVYAFENSVEDGSVIFRYCFEDNFGKEARPYYTDDKCYYVNSPETLYSYLKEKFDNE